MREGKNIDSPSTSGAGGLLILLPVLWEIGARLKWIDPFFFSSPLEIARTAVIKWQGGTLWRDIAYTGRINAPRLRAGNGHRVDRRAAVLVSRAPWRRSLNRG